MSYDTWGVTVHGIDNECISDICPIEYQLYINLLNESELELSDYANYISQDDDYYLMSLPDDFDISNLNKAYTTLCYNFHTLTSVTIELFAPSGDYCGGDEYIGFIVKDYYTVNPLMVQFGQSVQRYNGVFGG